MEDNEIIVQDAIGYSFKGLTTFTFIEEVANELRLEVNKYWMRPAVPEDWFVKGDWVILKQEPNEILLDEYELQYDIPYNQTNEAKVKFAEYLIDSMVEYIGYLEACIEKEMEKK